MDPITELNPGNSASSSASAAADSVAHDAKKRPWSTPTLTRLPGEETEVQPSFGIVKLILAGS